MVAPQGAGPWRHAGGRGAGCASGRPVTPICTHLDWRGQRRRADRGPQRGASGNGWRALGGRHRTPRSVNRDARRPTPCFTACPTPADHGGRGPADQGLRLLPLRRPRCRPGREERGAAQAVCRPALQRDGRPGHLHRRLQPARPAAGRHAGEDGAVRGLGAVHQDARARGQPRHAGRQPAGRHRHHPWPPPKQGIRQALRRATRHVVRRVDLHAIQHSV